MRPFKGPSRLNLPTKEERMSIQIWRLAIPLLLTLLPSAHAQFTFDIAKHAVQTHAFGSQGFAYSNRNNYLTMKTSAGSFAFTDLGANVSTQVTDKLRVGVQFYARNVG